MSIDLGLFPSKKKKTNKVIQSLYNQGNSFILLPPLLAPPSINLSHHSYSEHDRELITNKTRNIEDYKWQVSGEWLTINVNDATPAACWNVLWTINRDVAPPLSPLLGQMLKCFILDIKRVKTFGVTNYTFYWILNSWTYLVSTVLCYGIGLISLNLRFNVFFLFDFGVPIGQLQSLHHYLSYLNA